MAIIMSESTKFALSVTAILLAVISAFAWLVDKLEKHDDAKRENRISRIYDADGNLRKVVKVKVYHDEISGWVWFEGVEGRVNIDEVLSECVKIRLNNLREENEN